MVLQVKAWEKTDEIIHVELHESLVELLPEPAWVLNLNVHAYERKGLSSNFHKSRIGLKQTKGVKTILVGNAKQ